MNKYLEDPVRHAENYHDHQLPLALAPQKQLDLVRDSGPMVLMIYKEIFKLAHPMKTAALLKHTNITLFSWMYNIKWYRKSTLFN